MAHVRVRGGNESALGVGCWCGEKGRDSNGGATIRTMHSKKPVRFPFSLSSPKKDKTQSSPNGRITQRKSVPQSFCGMWKKATREEESILTQTIKS